MSRTSKRVVALLPIGLFVAVLAWYAIVQPGNLVIRSDGPGHAGGLKLFSSLAYPQARAAAEADGTFLLVYATASWCPPCQEMKKKTWPDPRLGEWVAQHGAAIMVDVDEDTDAARSLNIDAMPTMVLFKGSEVVGRTVGFKSADDLLKWLNQKGG